MAKGQNVERQNFEALSFTNTAGRWQLLALNKGSHEGQGHIMAVLY